MSARAAARLATIGFSDVRRYTPGKADWAAAGLPLERPGDTRLRAAGVARRDAPTCTLADERTVEEAMSEGPGTIRPDMLLERVVERLRKRNLQTALVTTSDGELIGVVRQEEAEAALQR